MSIFDTYADRVSGARSRAVRFTMFAARQPSWVSRVAAGAGVLVFMAVIGLLVIPAVLIAAAVFLAAAGVASLRARVLRLFAGAGAMIPRDEGRRNVRVIRRDE